ncbi:MAG: hypothetical protein ACQETH_15470 [Candidatus Rifleibacteriota bacterium]
MRKLYVILSCLFFFIILAAPEHLQARTATRLGVFYLPDPELFKQAGLRVTRAIVNDYQIAEIYRQLDSGKQIAQIKPLQKLISFKKAGVDVIITLRWPLDSSLLKEGTSIVKGKLDPKSMIDRVPQGADREQVLQYLKRFLNDFGDQIAVISLQNECLGGPGRYRSKDTVRAPGEFSAAGQWLIKVAKTVREIRRLNPGLSHLKISSPAWQAIGRLAAEDIMIPKHHQHPKIRLLGEIVKISNTYCDYVDIHPLEMSLKDLPQVIAFVKKHTDLPLITTEWSGLYQVREWLQEPVNPKFMALIKKEFPKLQLNPKNNEELVQFAHKRKTPLRLWHKFLEDMPHEKDFALRSFQLFEKEGFVYACWALGYQYNNSLFDLKTLFANMVTKEPFAPNEPAFSDFQRTIEYAGGTPWKLEH